MDEGTKVMGKLYRIIGATGPIDWLPDLTKNLP